MSRLRHEAGQTVVLIAVLLPLFLGLGAIAVDIGYWYVVKKTAQDAADAAALAAARDLPNADLAIPAGYDYVRRNMPDAFAMVSTPYVEHTEGGGDIGVVTPPTSGTPDPMKIEVRVQQHAGTFFGRMFGIFDAEVRARAVAERIPGDDNLAIFSYSNLNCQDGLRFEAEDVHLNGHLHSNGQFRIERGPFWAADGTFAVDGGCPASKEPDAMSQFGNDPSATLPLEGATRRWPLWHTPADFGWLDRCTYTGSTIEIGQTAVIVDGEEAARVQEDAIPSGTYCASTSFRLDGQGLHGRVTALAPEITVEGGGLELRPYAQDVLFFAVPNTDTSPENDGLLSTDGHPICTPSEGHELILDGSGHRWFGVIFNPCGRTVVNLGGGSGGAPTLEGAIVSDRVRVRGNGFEMIGRGDFEYSTALVE
jgi:hypothetical protein